MKSRKERPQTPLEVVKGSPFMDREVEPIQCVRLRQLYLEFGYSLGRALLPAKQDFVVAAVFGLRIDTATAGWFLEVTLDAPLLAWPAGSFDCAAPLRLAAARRLWGRHQGA